MSDRAGGIYLNKEQQSVSNRRKRQLMAKGRARATVLKRPSSGGSTQPAGNRRRKYPCCGRRRERCSCDWSDVEARLNSAAWEEFLHTLETAELKYARDTSDVGVSLKEWVQEDDAQHCVLLAEKGQVESDYLNFMFRMFVVRRYRQEVRQRLVPACPAAGTPAWPKMLRVFAELIADGCAIFLCNFRPATLRSYVDASDRRLSVDGLSRQAREVTTLKLLYRALPRQEIEAFAAAAGPDTFADMYDQLKRNLSGMQGVFGDYGIKCMLDMLVLTGGVPPEALSRWPTACPGYQSALTTLFPGLPPAAHLRALYWIHVQLGKTWRFDLPESCAQLCWHHRRQRGALDDAMDMDV